MNNGHKAPEKVCLLRQYVVGILYTQRGLLEVVIEANTEGEARQTALVRVKEGIYTKKDFTPEKPYVHVTSVAETF